VVGIDISSRALSVALESRGGDLFPRFLEADALSMSFRSSSFDVVFCGGAIAWMKDRHQAISESCRVMCLWGRLVVIPFFYPEEPLDELIANLNRLSGRILFADVGLERYFTKRFKARMVDSQKIEQYVTFIASRTFLRKSEPTL
jgi:ubiquinone/menaquinone biosynthesis C-methylase UbiE